MTQRHLLPFQPVDSSGPSFEVSVTNASTYNALESTALNRYWKSGPGSRSVRLGCKETGDYYVSFGTSDAVAASTDSMVMLGGTVEIFTSIKPADTHIAFYSSTDVTVNLTLGYGQ
jgi:hypothetical protein